MSTGCNNRICVISMVRNDAFFIEKWINYYGEQLGRKNLFLILDGHDQPLPGKSEDINLIRVPHIELGRAGGDRNRARLVSYLARSLFHRYDMVIALDIDEFLVVDPKAGNNICEYLLSRKTRYVSLSALGLDVAQHTGQEEAVDIRKPFLEKRSFAHVSARYTKAVVARRPLTWGSGFHRVKGRNFHIDPNLYLFHFGMVDFERSNERADNESLLNAGWEGHLERRHEIYDLIINSTAIEGDDFFRKARKRQSLFRPLYAINKPGTLKEKPVIRIPERFRSIV